RFRRGGIYSRDLSDQIILIVGDIDIARSIYCNAARAIEPRGLPCPIAKPRAGASKCADLAFGRYPANTAATFISYEQKAIMSDRDSSGLIKPCLSSPSIVMTTLASGKRGYFSGGCDLADRVVARVSYKEVALTIDGD